MTKKTYLGLFIAILATCFVHAQERTIYTINSNWKFKKGEIANAYAPATNTEQWETIDIPHTWNDKDCDDNVPGYYRGVAWYRKCLFIDECQKGRQVTIYFEGANQETKLYINGQYIGEHKGGYTRFCFDITPYIKFNQNNIFAISVDNSNNSAIPPLSADFTFYGGIYRDIYLQFMNPVHIATNNYASSGIYVNTLNINEKEANIEIKTLLTNNKTKRTDIIIENTIYDTNDKEIKKTKHTTSIEAGKTQESISKKIIISSPHLWDIDDPYLYKVNTRLYDKESKALLDEISIPIGLRWFKFDTDNGFYLNGKWRKLIGTSRHQDFFEKGNALRDELHVQDIIMLKDMGINFLRISHYPQDPIILEMCDKLGIVTSVEIPIVNAVTETEAFLNNSIEMAKEMVLQDYNHASIMIWGYMNEILLRRPYNEGDALNKYYLYTEKLARSLEDTIRKYDPSRYTMMAFHNAPKNYEDAHLTDIPMILGWNLYQGWYEPDINEFQVLLDRAHNKYKGKIIIVTEFGPGVDPRLHSYNSERFDFTQEYGLKYHMHYLKEICKRPFVAGANVWNFNDFYSESRIDAVPHVNNKGLVGLNREKKDVFLFYKANLTKSPFLAIGNKTWKARGGVANHGNKYCIQQVPLFTNGKEVEAIVNGISLGKKSVTNGTTIFDVPFIKGENIIEAISNINGKTIHDFHRLDFQLVENELTNKDIQFTDLNVLLGSHRYFDDREANIAWIPEQEYKIGSWGYVGGKPYRRSTTFGSMIGTDANIIGTNMNPIFQTQRKGIESFIADVPCGEYSIYLYWAELDSAEKKEILAYNLGADSKDTENKEKVFGVSINGKKIFNDLNIARDFGYNRAVIEKVIVRVKGNEGLKIDFHKTKGETILNAIRIHKNN